MIKKENQFHFSVVFSYIICRTWCLFDIVVLRTVLWRGKTTPNRRSQVSKKLISYIESYFERKVDKKLGVGILLLLMMVFCYTFYKSHKTIIII